MGEVDDAADLRDPLVPMPPLPVRKCYVWLAYWHQFGWFYLWKWTIPIPWLHRRTIYHVNHARQAYVDAVRRYWPQYKAKP